MRAVIQRVDRASVRVDEQLVGEIGRGMLVLLGVEQGDDDKDLDYVVSKCCGMRIFEDDQGKMNLDLQQVDGAMLVVSQFTLLGDCRKGRRPSFINAADPTEGERQYEAFCDAVGSRGFEVATGRFGADMEVSLVNAGPVTILLDSRKQL